jgi:parallel beta-helix repeat protein
MHMSAVKSEGYGDGGFNCVAAAGGATLSLEGCDLTCEGGRPVAQFMGIKTTVVMFGCCIHDGKNAGVVIGAGASATLENNTITDNDLQGVQLHLHSTATLTGNTIKGNGQCKIERTEEELATWPGAIATLYRSPNGFPGVCAAVHSTVTMPPGSNTIEGNGKVGSSREQVMVDETSKAN